VVHPGNAGNVVLATSAASNAALSINSRAAVALRQRACARDFVVFTLPAPIADIAYHNKAVIYDLLHARPASENLHKRRHLPSSQHSYRSRTSGIISLV
jgi:hypothetical protein